jgi:hypothetical protein
MKATHLLVLAFVSSATIAQGQQSASQFPQPSQSPPLVQHHASTIHEGVLRGTADGLRAVGEFNYNTAAAALIFEEARKAAYANEIRHAETFWAKKSLWETQMAARKHRHPIQVHEKPQTEQVGARVAPPFVVPSQQGFIWPAGLNHPAFEGSREKLAALFAERTLANSGAQSPSSIRIQNTVAEMRLVLSGLIRDLPPMAYVEARQFLDRAAYEANLPVQEKVAAIN